MKVKTNLLIGIFLAVLLFPLISADVTRVTNVSGNQTLLWFNASVPIQTTSNPAIGDKIWYNVTINITANGTTGGYGINTTSFLYHLEDNGTSHVITDYIIFNRTKTGGIAGATVTASVFTNSSYSNYVNFSGVAAFFNNSLGFVNGTEINLSFAVRASNSTKIGVSQSGRAYTETWNITTQTTNLTISNASITVVPTYWYTRIGSPTVTFNGTAVTTYTESKGNLIAHTDLDIGNNLALYGSGYGTLSVAYNGPVVDTSSGSSPSKTVPTEITPTDFTLWAFIGLGVLFVIAMMVGLAFLLKGKR